MQIARKKTELTFVEQVEIISVMNSTTPDRDPVAEAIESLLLEMQSKGMGSLYKTNRPLGIELAFDGLRAEGKTLDLALVRLANAMMDSEKFKPLLIHALKPLKSAAA